MGVSHRPTRGVVVVLMIQVPLFLTGTACTRRYYRESADSETYGVIAEKTMGTPWEVPKDFTIEPDPRSRFFDPSDPDDPSLPAPGPRLYEYDVRLLTPVEPRGEVEIESDTPLPRQGADRRTLPVQPIPKSYWEELPLQCVARMIEFSSVREEYRLQYEEDPPQDMMDASPRLSLEEIVELALLNSREHQSQKEQLYAAALDVTLDRYDYSVKFSPSGNGVDADYRHTRGPDGGVDSMGINSALSGEKLLRTGGTLLARFANNVVLTFNGPEGFATDVGSELFFAFSQSLLQRDIQMESLVQSERNLVYAARTYARFRRELFVQLAAQYYGLLRDFRSIEIESQNYFSLVRTFEQAQAEARAAVEDAPNPVAIDQYEQGMLSGRSTLISTCNGLERSLDDLKITTGLPTEAPINIDLRELDELTLLDEVEVSAERVRRWLGLVEERRRQTRPDRGDVLNGSAFLIERILQWMRLRVALGENVPDTEELEELLRRIRVDLAHVEIDRNLAELQEMDDPRSPAPVVLVYARTDDLVEAMIEHTQRLAELAEQRGVTEEAVSAIRRRITELEEAVNSQRERLAEILQDPQQVGLGNLLEEAREARRSLEIVTDDLMRLNNLSTEVPSPEERLRETLEQTEELVTTATELLRAAGSGLPPLEIAVDDAMATALVQRVDLMNQRGALADSWRRIKLAADELKAVVNIDASTRIGTRDNKPFDFSIDESETRVGVTVDLPLNRQSKRNAFRLALIDYQASRRNLMALEDRIKDSVRDELRNLEETRTQYPISVTQAALAAEQVISVRLQLGLGIPGVRGTDLLDALQSSRQALISVANARIGYLVGRANLVLDLEVMALDESGFWRDISSREYRPLPDTVYPDNAGPTYGELPSFLWLSSAIRRQLDHPLPGEPLMVEKPATANSTAQANSPPTSARRDQRRRSIPASSFSMASPSP